MKYAAKDCGLSDNFSSILNDALFIQQVGRLRMLYRFFRAQTR